MFTINLTEIKLVLQRHHTHCVQNVVNTVEFIQVKDAKCRCRKIQDAESEDSLNEAVTKDDVSMLLTQAGFCNELVTLQNKYGACQCIIIHVVLKQLREGLESVSLFQFLEMCHGCIKYAFPSVNNVKLNASDVINLINKEWLISLVGEENKVMNWFQKIYQRN